MRSEERDDQSAKRMPASQLMGMLGHLAPVLISKMALRQLQLADNRQLVVTDQNIRRVDADVGLEATAFVRPLWDRYEHVSVQEGICRKGSSQPRKVLRSPVILNLTLGCRQQRQRRQQGAGWHERPPEVWQRSESLGSDTVLVCSLAEQQGCVEQDQMEQSCARGKEANQGWSAGFVWTRPPMRTASWQLRPQRLSSHPAPRQSRGCRNNDRREAVSASNAPLAGAGCAACACWIIKPGDTITSQGSNGSKKKNKKTKNFEPHKE